MKKIIINLTFFGLAFFSLFLPVSAEISQETISNSEVPGTEYKAPQYGCCVNAESDRYICLTQLSVNECRQKADDGSGVKYINYLLNDPTCQSQQAQNYCQNSNSVAAGTNNQAGTNGSQSSVPGDGTGQGQGSATATRSGETFGCCVTFNSDKTKILGCSWGVGSSCEQTYYSGISGCYQSDAPSLLRNHCRPGADQNLSATEQSQAMADSNRLSSNNQTNNGTSGTNNSGTNAADTQMEDWSGGQYGSTAASGGGIFSGIVPCGRSAANPKNPPETTVPCTLCHFVVGIQKMLGWGLTIFLPIAIVMLTIAGIMYSVSAGNEGMMTTAKNFMWSVGLGVIFILTGWLIITTMLNVLGVKMEQLNQGATSQIVVNKWYEFSCSTVSRSQGRPQ